MNHQVDQNIERYILVIEYIGTNFIGWQKQPDHLSVHEVIERALSKFLSMPFKIQGASRTDSGVHAFNQIANLDLYPTEDRSYQDKEAMAEVIKAAGNAHLKGYSVALKRVLCAPMNFDVRKSEKHKSYIYSITNRNTPLAIDFKRSWLIKQKLDLHQMQLASEYLLGTHDFSTFRSIECQADSPIRTLDSITIRNVNAQKIEMKFSAKSFLQHQIRKMVFALSMVGRGKWQPSRIKEILEAKDKSLCCGMAPPDGLYLWEIIYKEFEYLATSADSND